MGKKIGGFLVILLCVAAVAAFCILNGSGAEAKQAFEGTLVKAGKMSLV